jgi:CO/xanthine dehydrogenase FAD-binding subunit
MSEAYYKPADIKQVFEHLSDEKSKNVILAGGTALALNLKGFDGLIDISDIGLSFIEQDNGSIHIGATTTIRDIQRSEVLRNYANGVVAESSKNYLTALIRNRATIGGLLGSGNFWADIVTVLVSLSAEVKIIIGNAEKTVPVSELVAGGVRKTVGQGGLITEIILPECPKIATAAYSRLAKVETDISIVNAAVYVERTGGKVTLARVVVSNGDRPVELKDANSKLSGQSTTEETANQVAGLVGSISMESDIRASDEYRSTVAAVLVRRLIESI